MDTPTPPPIIAESKTAAIPHQAAKGSWASAVIVFLLFVFAGRTGARVILELVALLLIVAGLVLGAVALFGVRKHGAKGILAPALVGILINGLLLFIFLTNFLAARAKAHGNANAPANFLPAVSASRHANAHQSYRSEGLRFVYDGAYQLRTNKETGQILLQHADSSVLLRSLGEAVDVVTTLKSQASALQTGLRNQSNSGFAQTDVEKIDGTIRSGGLLRIEYDKLAEGRIHMDVYLLSDQTNSVSVVHFYPERKKANARTLFAVVLQSLRDGD